MLGTCRKSDCLERNGPQCTCWKQGKGGHAPCLSCVRRATSSLSLPSPICDHARWDSFLSCNASPLTWPLHLKVVILRTHRVGHWVSSRAPNGPPKFKDCGPGLLDIKDLWPVLGPIPMLKCQSQQYAMKVHRLRGKTEFNSFQQGKACICNIF